MIIRDALNQGTKILKAVNIDAPETDAGVILCYVLNCDKSFLYVHYEYVLKDYEYENYFRLIKKRSEGMPVQYIIGHQEFMSLNFHVTCDVLVPRHDTEVLVETILEYAKKLEGKQLEILDIGTGSGCISVSLSHYINNCKVTAVDISEKALEVARKNAIDNGVNGKMIFLKSNLFENIEAETLFDIIVSNPPYIPAAEIKKLQKEVREFEPHLALDGGNDGLEFYRKITIKAPLFQKPGGILAFEVGYNQAEEVRLLMSKSYNKIKTINDISKIGRVVIGSLSYSSQILIAPER